MKIQTNAKINLTLKVTGILPNGFHSLESYFLPIDMHDDIEFLPSDELTFSSNCPDIHPENNTIIRAAKLFFETTNMDATSRCHLTKRIPLGGGLGGGSSNLAGTLLALNELTQSNLPIETLHAMAQTLSADAPFFLYNKPAIVTGFGEKVTPIPQDTPTESHEIIILTPNIHCCTKTVFNTYDKMPPPAHPYNDLQPAAFAAYPELENFYNWVHINWQKNIASNMDAMLAADVLTADASRRPFLTGSGSSIVLLSNADCKSNNTTWAPQTPPPCDYQTYITKVNIPILT